MDAMSLTEILNTAWDIAEEKGFHDKHRSLRPWQFAAYTKLALIHTEVAEATEELRKAKSPDDLYILGSAWAEELADIIIRVADLAADTGVSLQAEVESKLRKNADRSHLHGGKEA